MNAKMGEAVNASALQLANARSLRDILRCGFLHLGVCLIALEAKVKT